jgi:hypothetical protein
MTEQSFARGSNMLGPKFTPDSGQGDFSTTQRGNSFPGAGAALPLATKPTVPPQGPARDKGAVTTGAELSQ